MGRSEYIDVEVCGVCNGEGVVPDPFSQGLVETKCETCDGEGVVWFEDNIVPVENNNNDEYGRDIDDY